MTKMKGRLFFFDLDGDVRKVSVPSLDCIGDLISHLRSKYSLKNITREDPEFWTKDEKLGKRFKITRIEEITNGAVLEVIKREEKPSEAKQEWAKWLDELGPYRWNPKNHALDTSLDARLGARLRNRRRFADSPTKSNRDRPLSGGSNEKIIWTGRPDSRICATHNKQRTLPNLNRQSDGTWRCVEHSQCKTGGSPTFQGGAIEQVCSVHRKSRTLQNLEIGSDGKWVCIEGSRCITAFKDSGTRRGYGKVAGASAEYGAARRELSRERGAERGSMNEGAVGTVSGPSHNLYGGGRYKLRSNRRTLKCIIHGKIRTAANLRSDGCGGLVCLPTSRCR